MFVVASSAVVGFLSVLIGRWLHLDYSAKLWAMTFVLVVMVSLSWGHEPSAVPAEARSALANPLHACSASTTQH